MRDTLVRLWRALGAAVRGAVFEFKVVWKDEPFAPGKFRLQVGNKLDALVDVLTPEEASNAKLFKRRYVALRKVSPHGRTYRDGNLEHQW